MLDQIDPAVYQDEAWRLGYLDAERGRIAAARGDHAKALPLLQQAEAKITSGLGETHADTWLLRLDRAELLQATGQTSEARQLATQIRTQAATSIAPGGAVEARIEAVLRG